LGAARGLTAGLAGLDEAQAAASPAPATSDALAAAASAHRRLVRFLERVADGHEPGPELGEPALARLLSVGEGCDVGLARLAERAERERDRLRGLLADACAQLYPGRDLREAVRLLHADHPTIDGVLEEARALVTEVLAFTRDRG